MVDLTNGILTQVSSFVAAAAGLGTAAYGLVDASKALGGGVSNAGFKSIRKSVNGLIGRTPGPGMFGTADVLATLRANWLNGMPKSDQKAKAKSLVRLALTPANAGGLAWAVGVDPRELTEVAEKIRDGAVLSQQDLTILGRFDAVVSAVLDEAYERADQQYRNWSKFSAAAVAIILAVVGGGIIFCSDSNELPQYFRSPALLLAIVVGAMSTPLAPVAKDVSSAISAAVTAVGAWRR